MNNCLSKQEDENVENRATNLVAFTSDLINWMQKHELSEADQTNTQAMIEGIVSDLYDNHRIARNIAKVAGRPMTIALFGPSGAGKSYLVNELARGENQTLDVLLSDGHHVDFLTQICPTGGAETTAQVTRFTTRLVDPPDPRFPVHIRLLSVTDLVKILAMGYYYECSHPANSPGVLGITAEAACFRSNFFAKTHLTYAEMREIERYVVNEIEGHGLDGMAAKDYWKELYRSVSCASEDSQIRILSYLWGNIDAFTALFVDLVNSLKSIESEEIWAEPTCLLPRDRSIINVDNLKRNLRRRDDEEVQFRTSKGHIQKLPRSLLSALTAEIVLYVPHDNCGSVMSVVDILDFPGAKATGNNFSRDQIDAPPQTVGALDYMAEAFIRGKVGYLFNRYVELREITNLVLCCPPDDPSALSLPRLVEKWISQTHGSTPPDRNGKEVTLYVVFTKFDSTSLRQRENLQTQRRDGKID